MPIMSQRDRLGLHDEMGIGKTATTIGAINHLLAERGVLIVPAMLRENWIKEFRMFSTYNLRLIKARSFHDYVAWSRNRFDVLVCSYEQATKWASEFKTLGEYFDFLAIDEAHYLKNINANRTRAVLGVEAGGEDSIVQYAVNAWHITGTNIPNDPMDAYSFLRFVHATDMDQNTFTKYFFDKRTTAYGTRHTVKLDMLLPLQQMLANNEIRRTHQDVGLQLPPIWMKEVLIEGETSEIAEAIKDYPNLEELIVYAIEMNDLSMLNAAHISTVRRLVGKAKAVAYAQMLHMELVGGSTKRVAYFVHTEPLLFVHNYLQKYGYKGVVVYGDTNDRVSNDAVTSFMEDPSCAYFLGNMKKAGTGLTLTSSDEIDVVESDWSPANNAQAIKRVHRYGQTRAVHARFITLANSIDVAVNRTVAQKTANIAQIEGHAMTAAPLDLFAELA